MLNMSDSIRGYIDSIILAQLKAKDTYGYEINKTLSKLSEGQFEIKEATLYTAFRRLEQEGAILSYWGTENIGARRRYYALTDHGKKLLIENQHDWNKTKKIIDKLLGGIEYESKN